MVNILSVISNLGLIIVLESHIFVLYSQNLQKKIVILIKKSNIHHKTMTCNLCNDNILSVVSKLGPNFPLESLIFVLRPKMYPAD